MIIRDQNGKLGTGLAKAGKYMIIKRWKNHLSENNMTYSKHFVFAVGHGFHCICAGCYLIIHGFFPCFYQSSGSNLVHKLDKVFKRQNKK